MKEFKGWIYWGPTVWVSIVSFNKILQHILTHIHPHLIMLFHLMWHVYELNFLLNSHTYTYIKSNLNKSILKSTHTKSKQINSKILSMLLRLLFTKYWKIKLKTFQMDIVSLNYLIFTFSFTNNLFYFLATNNNDAHYSIWCIAIGIVFIVILITILVISKIIDEVHLEDLNKIEL